jgi:hypothetical protein
VFDADRSLCSTTTVINRFGSWSDALEEADIDDDRDYPGQQKYSDEDMLEMIQDCKDKHGESSPKTFNKDDEFCSVSAVMRRFGGWSNAKEEANVEDEYDGNGGRHKQYTDSQLLSHLREAKRRNGKVTPEVLHGESDLCAPSVIIERFGSWSSAKQDAGLTEDRRTFNRRPQKYSDEDYKELLRECEEKYGKVTQRLFSQDDDFPSTGAVRKRFGSWSDAKKAAGVDMDTTKYSRSDIINMLQTCYERYGKITANVFASDDDFCSPETVQREFGSWTNAKQYILNQQPTQEDSTSAI